MNTEAVANLSYDAFVSRVWPAWGMVSGVTIGWGVREGGYRKGFAASQLGPVLAKGWTRAMIHRPFGDDGAKNREPMNQDARVEGTEPMSADFADMLVEHRDTTFLAYVGSDYDPDFGRQLTNGDYAAWIDRKRRSILPLINATNCDIGVDHSANLHENYHAPGFPVGSWRASWAWWTMIGELKRLHGRRIWIESVPARYADHHHGSNFICRTFTHPTNGFAQTEWSRSRPPDDDIGGFADSLSLAPSQWLTGQALDWNTILGRHSLEQYAVSIGSVLARGPQWHWAGALNYLESDAPTLYRAVVGYAKRQANSND